MSATATITAKAAAAVTFKKLPGVVAITRGIVIGDATMFSELGDGSVTPLPVIRHGIRGTQNVDMDGKDSTAGTTKRREVSNIQVTDSAKADPAAVALIVRFGIRFAPLGDMPLFVATGEKDSKEDADALRESIVGFMARARDGDAAGLHEVARRYARNLANGRWLWRNRMVASRVTVTATAGDAEALRFDALGIPLNRFEGYSADEERLALALLAGLQGTNHSGIEIEARVEMGFGGSFEVYPSQNYLEEKSKGFARSLYCLGTPQPKGDSGVRQMGQAALRDQKVANALRTFDTWYPSFDDVRRPIAIEPNGASLEAQSFYRPVNSAASAFRLMGRLNEVDAASADGMFMLACLIRGGVYSGGKSK